MVNETEFVETVKVLLELNLRLVQQIHALGTALVEHGITTRTELGHNFQLVQSRTQKVLEKVQKLSALDIRDIAKDFEVPLQ